ncbi:hypothetical protein [Streptomyces sp. NPDC026092]|uniref:hypothetical protein n=1 Tax=Streptomyces sp. NPDC026092 TaxID=3154797 RepID=UPI0034002648
MTDTGWRVVLGVVGSCAFFWGVAGGVDLGLERNRRGWSFPDGGEWYAVALFAGFIVAYFCIADLTDRLAPWKAALIPIAGAVFGAVSGLLMGQQARHWVGAFAMVLVGSVPLLIVRARDRAARSRAVRNGST